MFLEVLGDPWDSPEKSKCCYFVGFRWFSEMSSKEIRTHLLDEQEYEKVKQVTFR